MKAVTGGASESNWYAHFRKHEGARSFAIALILSGLFHLSMVTVFRIVTYIPRHDIRYTTFTLVSVAEDRAGAPADDLTGPLAAEAPQLALRGPGATGGTLELPTLEFAELGRLRVREDSFREPERPEDLFRAPSDDSWARFSRGLSNLPRTLQLRLLGEETPPVPTQPAAAPAPLPASRPAEGFEAYVVWASEPRDRKLLFAPPIEALWNVDATEFTSPVEMVLQVNALGRVVNVFSPDSGDLVDAIQFSALQYRFAPLDVVQATNQTATLRVQRENRGDGG